MYFYILWCFNLRNLTESVAHSLHESQSVLYPYTTILYPSILSQRYSFKCEILLNQSSTGGPNPDQKLLH